MEPHGELGEATPAARGDLAEVLRESFRAVREATEALCTPLAVDDYQVQSMPEASPTKWHLGHTSWFFETLVLAPAIAGYRPYHPRFAFLFNSYYQSLGPRIDRPSRFVLTRPTVEQVYAYRHAIDARMAELLRGSRDEALAALAPTIVLGLNHEQQHQELILTDLLHAFWRNPLRPAYRPPPQLDRPSRPLTFVPFADQLRSIGFAGPGFSYDNERPRHRELVPAFELASRPSTNGEFLQFLDGGGYRRPELWLSDGWDAVQRGGWQAPLYWERQDGRWWQMSLGGMQPVDEREPVSQLSYYEADAFARWAGARLPSEAEWETAAGTQEVDGNFVESGALRPVACGADEEGLEQMFGDVWEWTGSAYLPYPRFRPEAGPASEYNGKFMSGQMVLRGGSCASPRRHLRASYRNYFSPGSRWQFSGVRLAREPG